MLPSHDYLLLFVGAPGGKYPLDRIRTMKGMFLLSQEASIGLGNLYEFRAYDWGPFSTEVYRDLDTLLAKGLIATEGDDRSPYERYRTTTIGNERIAVFSETVPPKVAERIAELKELTTSMSFLTLLEYVYERHPDYAKRSKLRR